MMEGSLANRDAQSWNGVTRLVRGRPWRRRRSQGTGRGWRAANGTLPSEGQAARSQRNPSVLYMQMRYARPPAGSSASYIFLRGAILCG